MTMKEIFECSAFAGVALSLVAYYIGVFLKKKLKLAIFSLKIPLYSIQQDYIGVLFLLWER